VRSKSAVVIEPISTLMSTSVGRSVCSCNVSLASIMTSMVRLRAGSHCAGASDPRGLDEIHDDDYVGTQLARERRLEYMRTSPPSDRILSPMSTGAKAPGSPCSPASRGQVALIEDDHRAAHHVGRDRSIGNRQAVEIGFEARTGDIAAQQIVDVAGADEAARSRHALRSDSELEVVAVRGAGALLFDRLQLASTLAADDLLPVDSCDERLRDPWPDADA
jgi:hypothetical protein